MRLPSWWKFSGRRFDAVQVEVTSRCPLRCTMCPRTALADIWPDADLPWDAYVRLARAFPAIRHVHLQGWGEPLLHPRLFEMITLAKAARCRVGLTTNGTLLTPDARTHLLALGVDVLAVSIAGASDETHGTIRVGSHLGTILGNVRDLIAGRGAAQKPKVELFYLMTRTNVHELPDAVAVARRVGADELVATNLDYVVSPEHERMKLFDAGPPRPEVARFIEDARGQARASGLGLRVYPLERQDAAVCEANPARNLCVTCTGLVAPCTYLGVAGLAPIPRRFESRSTSVVPARVGHVGEQDLREIWNQETYREFRRMFAARRLGVAARAIGVLNGMSGPAPLSAPPEACQGCYKLWGV